MKIAAVLAGIIYRTMTFDDFLKSLETVSGVIPVNAAIQYFKYMPDSADASLRARRSPE